MEEPWIHSLLACMPQILDDFLIFCSLLDNLDMCTCCRSVTLDFVNLRDFVTGSGNWYWAWHPNAALQLHLLDHARSGTKLEFAQT